MPILNLKVAPLQNPERYQALAEALTRLTVDILGKRAGVTAIAIEDFPAARWTIGAQPVQKPTAYLEISVTQGTNTPEEKTAWVKATWRELERQLAPETGLEEASYVIVRDVPATDWGYGGQTQRERQVAREKAAALA